MLDATGFQGVVAMKKRTFDLPDRLPAIPQSLLAKVERLVLRNFRER